MQAISRVNEKEAARDLELWTYEGLPEKLLESEPKRGSIIEEKKLESLEATELLLSNGMRITFRQSDLMQDQVLLSVWVSHFLFSGIMRSLLDISPARECMVNIDASPDIGPLRICSN
jgi:hypothetical protein